jgi:RimJ/RimL family protein N-acetyltransferase
VDEGAPPSQTGQVGPESRRIADATTIRPATGEGLDEIVQHTWDVAAEGRWIGTEVPFDRVVRRAHFADTSTAGGPGVVGHISIDIAPYGVANIGMLITIGWRGLGLGAMMLNAAIAWASAAGAHKIALEVWPHNVSAIELYRRAGFVEEGRKHRHYRRRNGEIWDSVLMGRSLP